jgi:hypothetical protein
VQAKRVGVLPQRGFEEQRLLGQHVDGTAEFLEWNPGDVDTVDADATG